MSQREVSTFEPREGNERFAAPLGVAVGWLRQTVANIDVATMTEDQRHAVRDNPQQVRQQIGGAVEEPSTS